MNGILLRAFSVLLVMAAVTACRKDPSPFDIQNLNGGKIGGFGHSGMGQYFRYPVNSFESVENCFEIGAEGTEIDVQMTRDSVLVLYHDEELAVATSMSGLVIEKTWKELQEGHFTALFTKKVKLQRVDDILTAFNDGKRIFTFDCKLKSRRDLQYEVYRLVYIRALAALIARHNLAEHCFIEGSDADFLAMLGAAYPAYKLFIYPANFEHGLETADRLALFGITIASANITAEQVQRAHRHGRRITV